MWLVLFESVDFLNLLRKLKNILWIYESKWKWKIFGNFSDLDECFDAGIFVMFESYGKDQTNFLKNEYWKFLFLFVFGWLCCNEYL